jgi:transposase-like protein
MSREVHLGKRAQWLDRLRRFNRSKSSASEFCRREGVSQASFYQWWRRLAAASAEAPGENPPTRASFVPVQLISAAQLQVVFPNGVRLTLPAHDDELIIRTIAAIAQAPTTSGDL